jgi:hypothetical protein
METTLETTQSAPTMVFEGEAFKSSMEIDKIGAALADAQAEMKGVGKTGNNSAQRYQYAKLEDYIKATRLALVKHGIAVTTSLCGHQIITLPGKEEGKFVSVRRSTRREGGGCPAARLNLARFPI